jgi:hypothetical protein
MPQTSHPKFIKRIPMRLLMHSVQFSSLGAALIAALLLTLQKTLLTPGLFIINGIIF